MRGAVICGLSLAAVLSGADTFVPKNQISGIGAGRDDLSAEAIAIRTERMIQSQTFSIMREPQALAGAKRITADPKLQPLFRSASKRSGIPASVLEAMAYLESWGDAKAESPAGPKGIMQVSEATARVMGLRIVRATRYRVTQERVPVRSKGKAKFRTVTRKTPYTLTVRDDRLVPARAIPAAAVYLAGMEQKFGGRDWAVFAYHCGQGCVTQMQEIARQSRGMPKNDTTVARMFFSCSPAWNRELYEAVAQQMERDYSPTYWFRVKRAEQLLALYRRAQAELARLAEEYRMQIPGLDGSLVRAPHRLSVWLKPEDLVYRSWSDVRAGIGKNLAPPPDRPEYFGYALKVRGGMPAAAPAAIGALAYIAFETRRLHAALKRRGEKFEALEVTALAEPGAREQGRPEAPAHASGQVFDIDYSGLPPGELECLRFVLRDLGWAGYVGYVEEGRDNLHIGCAPAAREFFTMVFREAVEN